MFIFFQLQKKYLIYKNLNLLLFSYVILYSVTKISENIIVFILKTLNKKKCNEIVKSNHISSTLVNDSFLCQVGYSEKKRSCLLYLLIIYFEKKLDNARDKSYTLCNGCMIRSNMNKERYKNGN